MSFTHRHGAALRALDEIEPERLPPMPEYEYRCPECADDVEGYWYEERGVGRVCCERCGGGDLTRTEDL